MQPMSRSISGLLLAALVALLAGCGGLLPKTKEMSATTWPNYQAAQETFDKIVPGQTTIAELRQMSLDPGSNPNIAILNYADVMRKFMLNQSFSINDLDDGVRLCVTAKVACKGFEINQSLVEKNRQGNVLLDVMGFYRETQTSGFRFNGLILLKDDIVVYKLTGGQPVIAQTDETKNPLGPVQALSSRFTGISF
jgi:hypothetical protein